MYASPSETPAEAAAATRIARIRGSRAAFAFAFCLACILPLKAVAQAPAEEQPDNYTLGPGDRVRVTVFGHEDLSGEFTISEAGTVSLPLAGTLIFGDAAVSDAEHLVVEALKPDYLLNPRVSVEVLDYRPFYIIGEVNDPGAYPYVNGMTVNEAVALGGGFTYRARKNRVAVIRASDATRTEISIAVTDAVQPGDVVRVLERVF